MRSCIHKMCCTHACNITCKTDAMHTCIHQMQYIHTYICTFIKYDTYKHATVTYKSYTRYDTTRCIHTCTYSRCNTCIYTYIRYDTYKHATYFLSSLPLCFNVSIKCYQTCHVVHAAMSCSSKGEGINGKGDA